MADGAEEEGRLGKRQGLNHLGLQGLNHLGLRRFL